MYRGGWIGFFTQGGWLALLVVGSPFLTFLWFLHRAQRDNPEDHELYCFLPFKLTFPSFFDVFDFGHTAADIAAASASSAAFFAAADGNSEKRFFPGAMTF